MLDFQWNSMMQGKGYGELGRPVYDKRMWDDRGSDIKAPTVRVVTDIAANIISKVSGCEFVAYIDDLIFAGVDLAGGYKTPEQVGKALAVQAVGAAVGAGAKELTNMAGGLQGAGKIFADIGIAGLSSGANTVAGAFINNMDISKIGTSEWFDGDSFANSMTNPATWASTVAAMAGAGVGGALRGSLNVADNKFYAGAISLASAGAGEAAKYGVYAAKNLAQGKTLADAYDEMGGLTINVANLGSIIDMIGSGIASTNETGQSDLGDIAAALSGIGLLEVNFGINGITTQLGMGGVDVGGNLYNLAKRMSDKAVLESYAADDAEKGAAATKAYVYGDWTAENTARRLGTKKDELVYGSYDDGTTTAETVANGKGGRTITMERSGNENNDAIQLQHEAHRDGVVSANQKAETFAAVRAHTEMALRMKGSGLTLDESGMFGSDISAYKTALASGDMRSFVGHALSSYDSSGDYWKLMGDGSVVFDGKFDLYDKDGNLLISTSKTGYIASLADVLGINEDQAESMLKNAGLTYKGRTFVTNDGLNALNNEDVRIRASDDVTRRLIDTYGNSAAASNARYYTNMVEGYVDQYKRDVHRQEILAYMPTEDYNSVIMTQEVVEDALGMDEHAACCITSDMVLNNEFQKSQGAGLTNNELIATLLYLKSKEIAFKTTGKEEAGSVSDHNILGEEIMNVAGTDSYLSSKGIYDSVSAMKKYGLTAYYTEYRIDNDDSNHMHIMAWSNGKLFDPETRTKTNRWWENSKLSSSYYRAFTETTRSRK